MIKKQKVGMIGKNDMKKWFFLKSIYLLLFFFGEYVFAQQVQELNYKKSGHILELKLPYQQNTKISKVFDEDTTLAIKILEMTVDGKQIFPEFSSIMLEYIPYMKVKCTRKDINVYYMRMIWVISNSDNIKKYVWNDLRSLESYIIREGNKNLFIRYKIVTPFPSVTIKKLLKNDIPYNVYSEEYCVNIDLSNVF